MNIKLAKKVEIMFNPDFNSIIVELRQHGNPANLAGMAKYGINTENTLGMSMPALRALAKRIGCNHHLALQLWSSGIHEARILAGLIADPAQAEHKIIMQWAADLNSWDVCDQTSMNFFSKTANARKLAVELAAKNHEFVKRAGFTTMSVLAVHDKNAPDSLFENFLRIIECESRDERNFVKKAVNWALRNIGKRSMTLHAKALLTAEKLAISSDKSARWIGKDAVRELRNPKIIERIRTK